MALLVFTYCNNGTQYSVSYDDSTQQITDGWIDGTCTDTETLAGEVIYTHQEDGVTYEVHADPSGLPYGYVTDDFVEEEPEPAVYPPLSSSYTVTNVSTPGGSDGQIILDISGGSGDCSYQWADGTTTKHRIGIKAGSYSVTITDNITGEIDNHNIAISEPGIFNGGDAELPNLPVNTDKCYNYFLIIDGVAHYIEEPWGSDDIEYVFKRHKDYHHLHLEYSDGDTLLQFHCMAGMDLIQAEYDKHGQDAEIGYVVLYMDELTEQHEILYKGSLNLNGAKFEYNHIACNVHNVSLENLIRTRFKTPVSLDSAVSLDGNFVSDIQPEKVELHSKALVKQSKSGFSEFKIPHMPLAEEPEETRRGYHELGFGSGINTYTRSSTYYLQFGFDERAISELEEVFDYPLDYNPDIPLEIYKVTESGTHKIEGRFKIRPKIFASGNMNIANGDQGDGMMNSWEVQVILNVNGTESVLKSWADLGWTYESDIALTTVDFSTDEELSIDDTVSVYMKFYASGDYRKQPFVSYVQHSFECEIYEESYFRITGETLTEASQADAFLLHEAVSKVVSLITSRTDIVKSDLLGRPDSEPRSYMSNGCASMYGLLSGFSARQFPWKDRPLNLSLEDILKGLKPIFNIGYRLETENDKDILFIGHMEDFFLDQEIMSFEDVSEYWEETAHEHIFNLIEVGYKSWSSEFDGGLNEICTKHTLATPIKKHTKKISLESELLASSYALEDARRNPYSTESQKDHKSDEKLFIVAMTKEGSQYKSESDEAFQSVTGIVSPETGYNYRITPERNRRRHATYLNSGLFYKVGTEKIKFVKGEGNYKLQTELKATESCGVQGPIAENMNIAVQDDAAGKKLFQPEWIHFEVMLTREKLNVLRQNPYGYISVFDYKKGEWKQGFIFEAKWKPKDRNISFKLLKKGF